MTECGTADNNSVRLCIIFTFNLAIERYLATYLKGFYFTPSVVPKARYTLLGSTDRVHRP